MNASGVGSPRLFEPVKIDDGPQIKTNPVLTIGRGGVPVMVVIWSRYSVQQSTQYFVRFMTVGGGGSGVPDTWRGKGGFRPSSCELGSLL